MRRPIAIVAATAAVALLAGCGTSYPRNEEGAFEGSVDRVREDNLRLNVGSDTLNVDTWSVLRRPHVAPHLGRRRAPGVRRARLVRLRRLAHPHRRGRASLPPGLDEGTAIGCGRSRPAVP